MVLSDESRYVAGVMLLTIVTIEIGGWFMTKIVRGQVPMTDFQKAFARAGHAHAGVLVTLGLVCQLLADATTLSGLADWVAGSASPRPRSSCPAASSPPPPAAASHSPTASSGCCGSAPPPSPPGHSHSGSVFS